MNNNSENQNYCADECSDHIKKIVNKSDELMEITRDEVFKYEKELKEKTINLYHSVLPVSLILNALITFIILKLFGG